MDTEKLLEDFVNLINSITDEELQENTKKAIEDSKESYIMDSHNEDKLTIQLGDYQIIAEINNNSPDFPPELCVYLMNDKQGIAQDICVVRQHIGFINGKNGIEIKKDNDFIDCLVWGNSDSEDYTEKHVIGVYKEDEE